VVGVIMAAVRRFVCLVLLVLLPLAARAIAADDAAPLPQDTPMELAPGSVWNDPVPPWDADGGYLVYCPCHGQLGRQVESFLGTLALARALNRTLVLPPFLFNFTGFAYVPFDTFFDLPALQAYHRVVPMLKWALEMAPDHWPEAARVGHCIHLDPKHQVRAAHAALPLTLAALTRGACAVPAHVRAARPGALVSVSHPLCACQGAHGARPRTWALRGILWVCGGGRGGLDLVLTAQQVGEDEDTYVRARWRQVARPGRTPVLALETSPGAVPAAIHHRALQVHLPFAADWQSETRLYIEHNLPRPYVAVHLRLGDDWAAHCASLDANVDADLSAFQCIDPTHTAPATSTRALCMPDISTLQQAVRRAVRRVHARSVYLATDVPERATTDALNLVAVAAREALEEVARADRGAADAADADEPVVLRLGALADDPQVQSVVGIMRDVGILAEADVAVLNCVSSLSSLVARERAVRPRPGASTVYWGRPLSTPPSPPSRPREEL
jgi:peptide-O-fucosyltransferase